MVSEASMAAETTHSISSNKKLDLAIINGNSRHYIPSRRSFRMTAVSALWQLHVPVVLHSKVIKSKTAVQGFDLALQGGYASCQESNRRPSIGLDLGSGFGIP